MPTAPSSPWARAGSWSRWVGGPRHAGGHLARRGLRARLLVVDVSRLRAPAFQIHARRPQPAAAWEEGSRGTNVRPPMERNLAETKHACASLADLASPYD